MKIVQFKNGTYGVRRFDLFELGYVYWDKHNWQWGTVKNIRYPEWREYRNLSDAQERFDHLTEEKIQLKRIRDRRKDRGKPIKS